MRNTKEKILSIFMLLALVTNNLLYPINYVTAEDSGDVEIMGISIEDENLDVELDVPVSDDILELENPDNVLEENGNDVILSGDNEELTGNDVILSGDNEELTGNDTVLSGNNEELTGNDSILSGNNEELTGNDIVLSGDNEETTGNIEFGENLDELDLIRETLNDTEISGQETYKRVTVNVQAPIGTFPDGVELRISPITTKNEIKEIKEQIVDSQDDVVEEPELVAFDIAFVYTLSDGTEVELQPKDGESVQVIFDYSNNKTFKKAEADDNQTIEVYHINDKDENGEKVEKGEEIIEKIEINQTASAEVDNGLVIDAEKFSTYTIVVQRAEQTDPNTGDPKTWVRGVDYSVISIPRPEGQTGPEGFTIMDRNLGADAYMGEEGKTAEDWYGYHYQRGNNYGFTTVGSVPTTSVGPEYDATTMDHNGYSGNAFITYSNNNDYWSCVEQPNGDCNPVDSKALWGGENDSLSNNRGLNTISSTATNRQGPCPNGWHVPSAGEWSKLIEYWAVDYNASGGNVTLSSSNSLETNIKSFVGQDARTAFMDRFMIPLAGYRLDGNSSNNVSYGGYYWTSTPRKNNNKFYAGYLSLTKDGGVYKVRVGSNVRKNGYSVRCFKDAYEAPVVVYTVSFDTGTGTITVDSQEIESGSTVSQPITQLTGYTATWYLDSGFVTPFDFDTPITGDITLYAKWHSNRVITDQMPNFTWGEISISRPESISTGPESYIIMDRNLGATSGGTVCDTGSNNGICGLLYQYGNNYGFSYGTISMAEKCNEISVNLNEYSPSNPYYDPTFVYGKKKCNNAGTDLDWAALSNSNIWGGQNGNYTDRQGPCPDGWHLPTQKEWSEVIDYWTIGESDQGTGILNSSNIDDFRNYFKLPLAGERGRTAGSVSNVGSQGSYDTAQTKNGSPYILRITTTGGIVNSHTSYNQVNGYSVRCFKNIDEDKYTVTFENWDGNELWSTRVASGETPVYGGNNPTRPATEESVYTFTGWYPELHPATHDETYTAIYTENPRLYTVTLTGTPAGYGTLSHDFLLEEYGASIVISGDKLEIGGTEIILTGNNGYEFQEWTGTCGKVEKYVCDEQLVYKHSELIEFTGGNNLIITNPGYDLFSESNFQKDFEISFDIIDQDLDSCESQAAILNVKDEDQEDIWPGFVVRKSGTSGKIEISARSVYGEPFNSKSYSLENLHTMKISRINSILYVSLNGGANQKVYDYSGFYNYFDKPIVFGSSYKDSDHLFRPAKVTLSNILIKTVDTSSCYTGNVYVVTGDCQMTAEFVASDEYAVTIAPNNAAYGSVSSGIVRKPYGTTITVNENTLNIGGTTVTATTGTAPEGHTYTFSGWTFSSECGSEGSYAVAEGCAITGNFEDEINEYTITIASNNAEYGSVSSGVVRKPYGTTITVNENTLNIGGTIVTATTGTAPEGHTYTFSGWTFSSECESGGSYKVLLGCEVTANFSSSVNNYTITWNYKDANGEDVIYTGSFTYGETPSHSVPSYYETEQTGYTFSGWTPELTGVVGPATYFAVYTETPRNYKVSFAITPTGYGILNPSQIIAEYGSQIITEGNTLTVGTGTVIATPATGDAQYTYNFIGWTGDCGDILTHQCTITALFDRTLNEYEITWSYKDANGETTGETETVAYNVVPNHADPAPYTVEHRVYTFASWTPTPVAAKANATYTATYTNECEEGYHDVSGTCTMNEYEITWSYKDANGETTGETEAVAYNVVPNHADPAPYTVEHRVYTFASWTPTPVAAKANATYTATYTWSCNANYHRLGDECISNDDVYALCDTSTLPANTVVSEQYFVQRWTGTGFLPETKEWTHNGSECGYECATDYHWDGSACVSEKLGVCEMPENPIRSGNYTTTGSYTWSGNEWVAPTCQFIGCVDNYHLLGETCISNNDIIVQCDSNTRPANTVFTEQYFVQRWTGTGFIPETKEWTYNGAECGFTCQTAYHRDGIACVIDSGTGEQQNQNEEPVSHKEFFRRDRCPRGDYSDSYYDGDCGISPNDSSENGGTHGSAGDVEIQDVEVREAYKWARDNKIIDDYIEHQDVDGVLTRGYMAKLMVNFIVKLGLIKPNNIPTECVSWNDNDDLWISEDIKNYATLACTFGIMGINMPNNEFRPNDVVSRAEFGTIVSRILWGDRYDIVGDNKAFYYRKHLVALKQNGIMKEIQNPTTRKEFIKRVLVVLRRIGEKE